MAQQTPAPPASGQSRLFLLAVGALVVVGLGIVAVVAGSRGDDTDTEAASSDGAETAVVDVTGTPLTPMPSNVQFADANNDLAYGVVAPTLSGTGFDGSDVVIENDGSAKVIYFVAHWCPHCQAEVPMIQGLVDDGKLPEGLDVYAVSTSVDQGRGNYPPSDWLAEEGFTPTVMRDDDSASALSAFGATSFPFAVYLNANNEVVARTAGSLDANQTEQLWQATATAP